MFLTVSTCAIQLTLPTRYHYDYYTLTGHCTLCHGEMDYTNDVSITDPLCCVTSIPPYLSSKMLIEQRSLQNTPHCKSYPSMKKAPHSKVIPDSKCCPSFIIFASYSHLLYFIRFISYTHGPYTCLSPGKKRRKPGKQCMQLHKLRPYSHSECVCSDTIIHKRTGS